MFRHLASCHFLVILRRKLRRCPVQNIEYKKKMVRSSSRQQSKNWTRNKVNLNGFIKFRVATRSKVIYYCFLLLIVAFTVIAALFWLTAFVLSFVKLYFYFLFYSVFGCPWQKKMMPLTWMSYLKKKNVIWFPFTYDRMT